MNPAKWAARRRVEQQRIIEEASERLIEILDEYGISAPLTDEVRGQACYVMGLESDYDPEEEDES